MVVKARRLRVMVPGLSGEMALTPAQALFVEHFAEYGSASKAAAHAGYRNPTQQAFEILSSPAVQEALDARERAIWSGELRMMAAHAVRRGLQSRNERIQLTAADLVYKRLDRAAGDDGRDIADYTADEIAAAIASLEHARAAKADAARPIDKAPVVIDLDATDATADASLFD